jgi:hypothetical protein
MMAFSHVTLTEALCRCETEAFGHPLKIIHRDHQFVNLLCNAGIMVTIKILHVVLSGPSCLPLVLPLEPYTNTNWTGEQYFQFFCDTANSPLHGHPPLETWGIIWDNLPARAVGLRAFLEGRAEDTPRIMLCLI